MSHAAKYIIVKMGNIEQPFVFSELLKHSDIARGICNIHFQVVSAGFCYVTQEGLYSCYGESISLKVKNRAQDSKILNELLGANENAD